MYKPDRANLARTSSVSFQFAECASSDWGPASGGIPTVDPYIIIDLCRSRYLLVLHFPAIEKLIAIVVMDEIVVTPRAESPTLYLAAKQKGKLLPFYTVNSSERHPPGLDMTRSANMKKYRDSGSDRMLAAISLRFPNVESMPRS